MNNDYTNLYGTWEVTTEGDVEGRTTKHLGTHTGWVDEIALYLGNKCYYSLCFKRVEQIKTYNPTVKSVNVCFDIDSKTWNLNSSERKKQMSIVFKDRPVIIEESNFYASFTITSKTVSDDDIKRQKALNKLNDEEKKLLGLT